MWRRTEAANEYHLFQASYKVNRAYRRRYKAKNRASLWLAVYRLITLWANKYHQTGESRLYDADDLLQAGYLALVDAIQGYDPERDAEFTSYLRYHCRRHFAAVAGIRTSKRYLENYAVSLNVPLDDSADITRLDTLEDPAADFEDDVIEKTFTQQAAAALLKEADKLDEQPRSALLLTAWDGLPLREAAEKMNLSIERVRQCREKAARKLRNTRTGRQIALEYYCYRHVSLSQFRASHTSATEAAILWLEQFEEQRRFFAKVGGDSRG